MCGAQLSSGMGASLERLTGTRSEQKSRRIPIRSSSPFVRPMAARCFDETIRHLGITWSAMSVEEPWSTSL
jgi:hypothetical protein